MKKYIVFAAIFLGYGVLNYNRKSISYCIPKIIDEGLDSGVVGTLLTGQNMAYAISKFYGGLICDRVEPKLIFAIGLLFSGLSAMLFSLAAGPNMMIFIWFVNGLSQGLGWPAVGKLLTTWFEPSELGLWWSLSSASANLAGSIGPYLGAHLVKTQGWRGSMFSAGVGPCLVAVAIYIIIGSKKAAAKKGSSSTGPKQDKSIMSILRRPTIYVVSLTYLVVSLAKTFLTDWSQVYLISERRQTTLAASAFVSSIEFGGLLGGIGAGLISDIMMRRSKATRGHPRMYLALVLSMITAACFYTLINHAHQVPLGILGLILGASVYGQIAIFGIVATQSIVQGMGSSSHAIAAMFANVGSMLAGLPVALLANSSSWTNVVKLLMVVSMGSVLFMTVTIQMKYDLGHKEEPIKQKKKKE